MIYPSARLFIGIAAGAALAMVVGVVAPSLWLAPLVWTLLLLSAAAVDVVVALRRSLPAQLEAASAVIVGDSLPLRLVLPGGRPGRVTEAAFSADDLLRLPDAGRVRVAADGTAQIMATALRRGIARVTGLDLRWQGPLGLAWLLRRTPLDRAITITPDLRPVHSDGVALLARDARVGMMVQLVTGPGGEFEALADYQPGMDRRRIDWKQSARHSALLAKEFHTERDNNIVLAFDCGRTMIEPLGGLARLDRAITAGLLTGYVALKMGDRVSLFGFDAQGPPAVAPAHRRRQLCSVAPGGRRARLRRRGIELHPGAVDPGAKARPPLADHPVHRFRRCDLGRTDAARRRPAARQPCPALRRHAR